MKIEQRKTINVLKKLPRIAGALFVMGALSGCGNSETLKTNPTIFQKGLILLDCGVRSVVDSAEKGLSLPETIGETVVVVKFCELMLQTAK